MTDRQTHSGPGPRRPDGTVELVIELRRASRRAEALLQDAMDSGGGDLVLRLDEASQGLHRALVALES